MLTVRLALGFAALLLGACAAESSLPEPTTTSDATVTTPPNEPIELSAGAGSLPAGTYTHRRFQPQVTFAIDADGWYVGTLTAGFFDIQQDRGSPDVVAVQFARVLDVVGDGGAMFPASIAEAAVEAIKANPGLVVIDESTSQLGGLEGWVVEVENAGQETTSVMRIAPGTLAFDPNRRLWIGLFDTADGVMAVLVGGSVAGWDRALALAEPVLKSITIAGA